MCTLFWLNFSFFVMLFRFMYIASCLNSSFLLYCWVVFCYIKRPSLFFCSLVDEIFGAISSYKLLWSSCYKLFSKRRYIFLTCLRKIQKDEVTRSLSRCTFNPLMSNCFRNSSTSNTLTCDVMVVLRTYQHLVVSFSSSFSL